MTQPSLSPRSEVRRALRARLVVQYSSAGLVLGVLAALAFDAWYESHLYEEARTKVASEMAPAATALRSAVDRRVVLLNGLWSFAEAAPTRARLDADFPSFARGLLMAVDGVRALQFVQEGRIVATWPMVGNERALGFDLLSHPNPIVREGVRRAMATDSVVVTGPVELVQGGMGLLARRRLNVRRGFPRCGNDCSRHSVADSRRRTAGTGEFARLRSPRPVRAVVWRRFRRGRR